MTDSPTYIDLDDPDLIKKAREANLQGAEKQKSLGPLSRYVIRTQSHNYVCSAQERESPNVASRDSRAGSESETED